ncbi:hypothetical protein GE21DRAFT_1219301 [Neurospora crassa]|nr:hypothetical protein B24B19.30 [imported] - Neurospora crassa [Neurospora crassa]KHE80097.1 hypothetical protein GE21DRAFT_1219301 [Neurospora crassa]
MPQHYPSQDKWSSTSSIAPVTGSVCDVEGKKGRHNCFLFGRTYHVLTVLSTRSSGARLLSLPVVASPLKCQCQPILRNWLSWCPTFPISHGFHAFNLGYPELCLSTSR